MIGESFDAMGTTIDVRTADEDGITATRRWFEEVEAEASRFRPASALSVINRSRFTSVDAPPLLARLLGAAWEVRSLTGGLVDPVVGGDVIRWGYDRSFPDLAEVEAPVPGDADAWWSIDGTTVTRPPGTLLDLGGIAKGWAADRAVESGLAAIVSAGGDVRSTHPDATVEVEDPQGHVVAEVLVGRRALATSSVARRRWRAGHREAHHLIDPRTGDPVVGPIVSATAVAARATWAEGAAKATLIHGVDGLDWASRQPWIDGAIAVWADGSVYATNGLELAA